MPSISSAIIDRSRIDRSKNKNPCSTNAPDSSLTPEKAIADVVIWGTPEKVAEELLAFREEIGDFGTLLYCSHDWVDPKLAKRSMDLMAEKVMPAVNRAIASPHKVA